jgi:hypothetical protein
VLRTHFQPLLPMSPLKTTQNGSSLLRARVIAGHSKQSLLTSRLNPRSHQSKALYSQSGRLNVHANKQRPKWSQPHLQQQHLSRHQKRMSGQL